MVFANLTTPDQLLGKFLHCHIIQTSDLEMEFLAASSHLCKSFDGSSPQSKMSPEIFIRIPSTIICT